MLKSLFIPDRILYDGTQIHSHWAYRKFSLLGDSIVAFIGPCDVKREEMVDLEDLNKGETIRAKEMLHFICEHFNCEMREIVLLQRLLVFCAKEAVEEYGWKITRKGDDLFCENRKLSISIATKTPVSFKIHFALNIDPEGAPVPAIGLKEMGIDPISLGKQIIERYKEELQDIYQAICKAKGVP
ncbi:MAG: DUF366 family protein [bacterium]